MSILIPREFIISDFRRYNCFINDPANIKKGLISLNNMMNIYEQIPYKRLKFKNVYDFEKAFHTNNWSPIIMFWRKISTPEGEDFKIEEIDSTRIKGFIRSTYDKKDDSWMYICSFYSKDNRNSREMTISGNKEFIANIISSFSFLKQQKAEANEYYKKGLKALNADDFITAQFKFANAYYLSPENPEYGYMLAKTLFMNGNDQSVLSAKIILLDILKLKPDYEEAKDLLKIIESELSKEKK